MRVFSPCGFLLFIVCLASAQPEPAPAQPQRKFPLPEGPLLRPAPSSAKWLITISYEDEKQLPASVGGKPAPLVSDYFQARPRAVVTTRTGNRVHEELQDSKGRVRERWFDGPSQFTKDPAATIWEQTEPSGSGGAQPQSDYVPLPPNGFRDLTWVSPSSYAGTIQYGGYDCLVFIPGGEAAIDLAKPELVKTMWARHPMIACIDARSRLPIALRYINETRVFKWENAPSSPLTFPPDLSAMLQKKKEDQAKLFKQAAAP